MFDEVRELVVDERFDRPTRLARLQGWRGPRLDQAVRAGRLAHAIGPATCSVLALAIVVTGSRLLLALTLATALVGAVAPNHPAETAWNLWIRHRGGTPLPPNRAAKRLGCAMGSVFLGAGWVALESGTALLANLLLLALAALAGFVAVTGLCVPSMVFTALFGARAGTRSSLLR